MNPSRPASVTKASCAMTRGQITLASWVPQSGSNAGGNAQIHPYSTSNPLGL